MNTGILYSTSTERKMLRRSELHMALGHSLAEAQREWQRMKGHRHFRRTTTKYGLDFVRLGGLRNLKEKCSGGRRFSGFFVFRQEKEKLICTPYVSVFHCWTGDVLQRNLHSLKKANLRGNSKETRIPDLTYLNHLIWEAAALREAVRPWSCIRTDLRRSEQYSFRQGVIWKRLHTFSSVVGAVLPDRTFCPQQITLCTSH